MTDAFDRREQAFEAKHQLDETQRFRLTARRDHLFGLWAARELGLSDGAAERYAQELVEADLTRAGEEGLIARVLADLTAKDVPMTDGRLRIKLERFRLEAQATLDADL